MDGDGDSHKKKRCVLVVDDHPLFRHGVADLIKSVPDLELSGEAESVSRALEAIGKKHPDLVIADISLRGANGIDLIKAVRAKHPKLPVLVLSMHDEGLYAARALRAGARGYVMKQEPLDRVLDAIHTVLAGELYVSPAMSRRMIEDFVQGQAGGAQITDKLTDRELEVLQFIGEGCSVPEIAQALSLSVKTVESHRAHIKEKLRFKTAREVARFAMQWVHEQQSS